MSKTKIKEFTYEESLFGLVLLIWVAEFFQKDVQLFCVKSANYEEEDAKLHMLLPFA